MKNVLFVGGPKDGLWETFEEPLLSRHKMVGIERILPSGPVEKEVFYRLEYLASGIESHSVYFWQDIPTYELVPTLLRGYRQEATL